MQQHACLPRYPPPIRAAIWMTNRYLIVHLVKMRCCSKRGAAGRGAEYAAAAIFSSSHVGYRRSVLQREYSGMLRNILRYWGLYWHCTLPPAGLESTWPVTYTSLYDAPCMNCTATDCGSREAMPCRVQCLFKYLIQIPTCRVMIDIYLYI